MDYLDDKCRPAIGQAFPRPRGGDNSLIIKGLLPVLGPGARSLRLADG
jgi:hypothetical protein